MFALIVTGREMRADLPDRPIVGAEGDRYWVALEPEGWVPASSTRCKDPSKVPGDAKTFASEAEAAAFAISWKGHPWWCSPRGEYEIVPVKARYRRVFDGWDRVD